MSSLGAHHVIDHSKPLAEELKRAGLPQVNYIASLNQTDAHFDQLVEALAPQGKFGLIDDPAQLDVRKLKRKSASLHWEFMFTRSMFTTPDIAQQNALLNRVAELVDQGTIKTHAGPNTSVPSTRPISSVPMRCWKASVRWARSYSKGF